MKPKKRRKGIYFSYDAVLALSTLMIGMVAITQFSIITAESPTDNIETSEKKIIAEDSIMTAQYQDVLRDIQIDRLNNNNPQQTAEDHFNNTIQDKGYQYGINITTSTGTEEIVPLNAKDKKTVTTAILPSVEDGNSIQHANQMKVIISK